MFIKCFYKETLDEYKENLDEMVANRTRVATMTTKILLISGLPAAVDLSGNAIVENIASIRQKYLNYYYVVSGRMGPLQEVDVP
jgi:hypothetical protein